MRRLIFTCRYFGFGGTSAGTVEELDDEELEEDELLLELEDDVEVVVGEISSDPTATADV